MSYNVAIIGGAGHVGLPLALVLAEHGNYVVGIDINEDAVEEVNSGRMPFYEEGAETLLKKCLISGRFGMTTDLSRAGEADVIVIILGTPVNENFNPVLSGLAGLIDNMCPYLREGQRIILRSTVSPGTTDRIKKTLEKKTGMVEGEDFDLIYAPERVLQGKAISRDQVPPAHHRGLQPGELREDWSLLRHVLQGQPALHDAGRGGAREARDQHGPLPQLRLRQRGVPSCRHLGSQRQSG